VGGWVGGIKIKAKSVQLRLNLPVRTELGNNNSGYSLINDGNKKKH